MGYKRNMEILGNGCFGRGRDLLESICQRLEHARGKHPWPRDAESMDRAHAVISSECWELESAVRFETPERAHDEALDVVATAVRFCNREWELG